ncbi:2406_t:CDS:2, partial [Paraglomus occultum]
HDSLACRALGTNILIEIEMLAGNVNSRVKHSKYKRDYLVILGAPELNSAPGYIIINEKKTYAPRTTVLTLRPQSIIEASAPDDVNCDGSVLDILRMRKSFSLRLQSDLHGWLVICFFFFDMRIMGVRFTKLGEKDNEKLKAHVDKKRRNAEQYVKWMLESGLLERLEKPRAQQTLQDAFQEKEGHHV